MLKSGTHKTLPQILTSTTASASSSLEETDASNDERSTEISDAWGSGTASWTASFVVLHTRGLVCLPSCQNNHLWDLVRATNCTVLFRRAGK